MATIRQLTDYERLAAERWQECSIMADTLRKSGVNATTQQVNRYYKRCREWYMGRLALGYLLRVTGLQPQKGVTPDDIRRKRK